MKKVGIFVLLLALAFSNLSFTNFEDVKQPTNDDLELLLVIDVNTLEDEQGWSTWRTTDCLRGLDFRVKNGGYNQYAKKYRWSIDFRNRYQEKIHFSYKAVAPSQEDEIKASGKTTDRLHVDANGGTKGSYYLVPSSDYIYVYVNRIRIGPKDYGSGYIDCDK